jgi:hypothetical protein|tara:strand:+ start:191 stop:400 length:210 start_codon:yes stop_codon:yes gene_type:complete
MYQNSIKREYKKATNKKELTKKVAEYFGMNPRSVQCNWFSGFYQVPEKHQGKVVDLMQNYNKNKYKTTK